RILGPLAIDVLYIPEPEEMYPTDFSTTISVSGVSAGLCGGDRPGHFDGVATVVTKLLLQTDADCTFFGEKDYQQLQVVRRVVADLDLKTEIVACPTVREDDGLAMSSRNLRLGKESREVAPVIGRVLESAANVIGQGGNVAQALQTSRQALLVAGFDDVDYFELRSDPNLQPLMSADRPARLFVAAWLNGVRLIDNTPVKAASHAPIEAGRIPEPV
ncbi:pantoate--beta-alanine ligase, partial [Sulfitobacter sp. HI0040]